MKKILYCPTCTEKLDKSESIDIFIEKYLCKNNHQFYIQIKDVYASESKKISEIIINDLNNEDDIILKMIGDINYRKFLNSQLALILRRIYEIKKFNNNIVQDGISQFIYCPLCKEKILKFDQDDIWVQGLKCKNNHSYYFRGGLRYENFHLYDDLSNKSLLYLIKAWVKTDKALKSDINKQIKKILKNFVNKIETIKK